MSSDTPDLFVQDATAGIWVHVAKGSPALSAGAVVDLEGVTEIPDFAPQIGHPRYRVIGRAALPQPRRPSLETMLSTAEDSQWVETRGIVRKVKLLDGLLTLDLAVAGGRLMAVVPGVHDANPSRLVDAEVRLRGVCGAIFNKKLQLVGILIYAPDFGQLNLLRAPAVSFAQAVQPVETVARFAPQRSLGHRIRVQGTVTLQESGRTVYLSDGRTGIRVEATEAVAFQPGDRLDVIGFPKVSDYTVTLEDSVCRRIGFQARVSAIPVTMDGLLSGDYDSLPVLAEGTVLGSSALADRETIVLNHGGVVFGAVIREPHSTNPLKVPVGSVLRVAGICVSNKDGEAHGQAFRIVMQSGADARVVRKPPWWTVQRMLAAMAVLAFAILGVLAWVVALRRQAALEQRYQDLVEHANDIIFTLDLKQNLTSLNQAGERILGYASKEAAGMPLARLIPPVLQDKVTVAARQVALGEPYPNREWELAARDGVRTPVEVSLQAIRKQGKLVGLLGVARDISERKRAEDADAARQGSG